jgi:hypothetical protein
LADAACLQGLGMRQFPQSATNGRAAQPGDRGQSRDAATTALHGKDGGDQPTSRFVREGEELVQDGVLLGDMPLRVFAALGAGADVRSPTVSVRRHDRLTRGEETMK